MSSPPQDASGDDPLETVNRYITGIEARCALQVDLLRQLTEEGRDTSRAERVLRDMEATLSVLRQRQRACELEARASRLVAASREKLASLRPPAPARSRRTR